MHFLCGVRDQPPLSTSGRAVRLLQDRTVKPTDGPTELRSFMASYLEDSRIRAIYRVPTLFGAHLEGEYDDFVKRLQGHDFREYLARNHPDEVLPVDQTDTNRHCLFGMLA